MLYVRRGEGNLGRMKDGETIRRRITRQAFISPPLQLAPSPPSLHLTPPSLHHRPTPPLP